MSNNTLNLDEVGVPHLHTLRALVVYLSSAYQALDLEKVEMSVTDAVRHGLVVGASIKLDELNEMIYDADTAGQDYLSAGQLVGFTTLVVEFGFLTNIEFLDLGFPIRGTVFGAIAFEAAQHLQRQMVENHRHVVVDAVNSRAVCQELIGVWRLLPILSGAVNAYQPEVVLGKGEA